MRAGITATHIVHRFLSQNMVYPLTLSTLLVGFIWLGRVIRLGDLNFGFIPYNLALAWVPYLFSLLAALLHARWPR